VKVQSHPIPRLLLIVKRIHAQYLHQRQNNPLPAVVLTVVVRTAKIINPDKLSPTEFLPSLQRPQVYPAPAGGCLKLIFSLEGKEFRFLPLVCAMGIR